MRDGDNLLAMSVIKDQQRPPGAQPSGQHRHTSSLLLHFRPGEVPERTLRLTLSWGLGGMATVLLFLLIATGLLLKFVFEPFPDRAYDSIIYLQAQVPFGQLMRNLHRWSGNALVFVAFLHMLRVFYTGAIDRTRRANWLIGMAIFAVLILANFTGYLLPWDQFAFWAITISTSMLDYLPVAGTPLKQWILGGAEPSSVTLINFYTLHTAILPTLLVLALPFHFWRIRKANGLVVPRTPKESPGNSGKMVAVVPHLLVREVALALMILAALLLFSMFFNASLAEPANPGLSPNPTKAPWYFMGFQELLLHFHPVFSVFIIPALVLVCVLALPWMGGQANLAGTWFRSRRGRALALASMVVAVVATVAAVVLDESARAGGAPGLFNRGVVPLALILGGCVGYFLLMQRILRANRDEAIQALFTLAVTAFIVLTVIGVWFRGAGMQLMWAG